MNFTNRKINFKETNSKKLKKLIKKTLKKTARKAGQTTKELSLKTKSFTSKNKNQIRHTLLVSIPLAILVGIFLIVMSSAARILNIAPDIPIPCFICSELKTDSENRTNMVIAGIGGEEHSGGDLTDTIILASIDHENKKVSLLSLPRDLWVETQTGGNRINRIYEYGKNHQTPQQGMEFLSQVVTDITAVNVHYYILIDFNGLVDIVDAIDGVDIYVPEDLYDPYYPKDGTIDYEPFSIAAGWQHLSGARALKYARSRKTSSDYSRSKRQHDILSAIKDQAVSVGVLSNPTKLQKILDSLDQHFLTNINWKEMLAFADIAPDFTREKIYSTVYNDQWHLSGGLLYTPERKYFNGAFVLLPNTLDYSETRMYTYLFNHYPEMFQNQVPIQILNGTKHTGIAKSTYDTLIRHGFNAISYSNTKIKDHLVTEIYYLPEEENNPTIQALDDWGPFTNLIKLGPSNYQENFDPEAKIFIILGEDFLTFFEKNKKWFY